MQTLPEGWTTLTIGDLVERLQYGYTASAIHGQDGVRFLRITDIENGHVDWAGVPTCRIEEPALSAYALRDGDVVFARTGSIEKACVLKNPPRSVFASYLIRGTLKDPRRARWLDYFVRSASYVGQVKRVSAGIGRPNVNAKNLARVSLNVPPLSEQDRIVEALDSYFSRLDEVEAGLERVQRNLKRDRASVLQAAVTGRLVPTEAELARAEGREYEPASELLKRILAERRRRWEESGKRGKYEEPAPPDSSTLPELPEGWCWARVGQVAAVSGGLTQNAKRRELRLSLPFLRVANVYAGELRLDDIERIGVGEAEVERVLLRQGDLLVVEGNGSLDQIGRVARWDGSIEPCVHQNHLIKVRFELDQLGKWALAWLLSPGGRQSIESIASSTSGLHTLSLSKVEALPVPLCPVQEQVRVLDEMERLLTLEQSTKNSVIGAVRRNERLRQSVLKSAFEGRLLGRNPTDELAKAEQRAVPAGAAALVHHSTAPQAKRARRGR